MYINWDVDPNSVLPSTLHGIPIPSYGNYGGQNYSAGEEGGRTPEFGTAEYFAHPPKDDLDQLFYAHDLVYQHLEDGTATLQQTFDADAKLLEGMFALTQSEPALFTNEPEALVYEGFAAIGILGKIETTPGEREYLQSTLLQSEEQLPGVMALQNFENTLVETPGSASGSLPGASHMFETHLGDLLT